MKTLLIALTAIVWLIVELRNAPEGYEDERGFSHKL